MSFLGFLDDSRRAASEFEQTFERVREILSKPPTEIGPSREGSPRCESGSIASGGTREFCTCDACF